MQRGGRLSNDLFVILPYLKTSAPVTIRGITYRPSSDLEGLTRDQQEHFQTLFQLFVTPGGQPIGEMVYAFLSRGQGDHIPIVNRLTFGGEIPEADVTRLDSLWESHLLLQSVNSGPDAESGHPLLPAERSTLFLAQYSHVVVADLVDPTTGPCQPLPEVPIDLHVQPHGPEGYELLRNWRSHSWVSPDSRITPHFAPAYLVRGQDLFSDVTHFTARRGMRPFARLVEGEGAYSRAKERRVFRTLDWYGKATAADMDEREVIVNLAIALESLLGISRPRDEPEFSEKRFRLSTEFVDRLNRLLGSDERVRARVRRWAKQFYRQARSAIVHTGATEHFYFVPPGKHVANAAENQLPEEVQYIRSLSGLARRILYLSVAGELDRSTRKRDIVFSWLFTSRERVIEAQRLLIGRKPARERLYSAADVLLPLDPRYGAHEFPMIESSVLVTTGKELLRAYLRAGPKVSQGVRAKMEQLVRLDPDSPLEEQMNQFMELRIALSRYASGRHFGTRDVVRRYLEFMNSTFHMLRGEHR